MKYMTNIEALEAFEREINKLNDNIAKPNTEDSLFWLNQAICKFAKLRFNGDFVHKTSFEENEKRREDLINLFSEYTCELSEASDCVDYLEYTTEYPKGMMYILDENVIITNAQGDDDSRKHVGVFECTRDSFMYRIMNSLTDFHYKYKYARPIRIRTESGCKLLTDKNYIIEEYKIGYLRFPKEININDDKWDEKYTDFSKHTMYEIIKIAAQMYIENTTDPRYQTISAEVNTQE